VPNRRIHRGRRPASPCRRVNLAAWRWLMWTGVPSSVWISLFNGDLMVILWWFNGGWLWFSSV
jgi:hypothetical protein